MSSAGGTEGRLTVSGIDLQVWSGGDEIPLLVLHDYEYTNAWHPFLDLLAREAHVFAPSHPGFGTSALPEWLDSVDDLAYFYLDVLERIGPAHVLGLGFGGWIAAEAAVRSTQSMRSLILTSSVGVKVSGREERDIADHFVMLPDELIARAWDDPAVGARLMKLPRKDTLDEAELTQILRNRQAAALFGWKPFMHNPKLLRRLRRVNIPTLVLWGESDRIVTPAYGQALAQAIPGATISIIPHAGHYPYLEQPRPFVDAVRSLLQHVPAEAAHAS